MELEEGRHLERGQWVRVGPAGLGQVIEVDDECEVVEVLLIHQHSLLFAPQAAVEPVDFDGEFFVMTSHYWEEEEPLSPVVPARFMASMSLLAFYLGVNTALSFSRAVIRKVFPIRD